MAISFCEPDGSEGTASAGPQQPPPAAQPQQQQPQQLQQPQPEQQLPLSPTSAAATQTPPLTPVTGDELVKAIYDALCLLTTNSVAGTPVFATPPSSPYNANNHGNVFFCRSNIIPQTPNARDNHQSPQRQQFQIPFSFESPQRSRLNSTGSTSSSSMDDSFPDINEFLVCTIMSPEDPFEDYMEERNALPEFSGKIPPQRLAKAAAVATAPPIARQPPANAPAENISGGAMQKITDPKFVWPTVVGAVAFLVGCRFFASR